MNKEIEKQQNKEESSKVAEANRKFIVILLGYLFYVIVLAGLCIANLTDRIPSFNLPMKIVLLSIPAIGGIAPFIIASIKHKSDNHHYWTIFYFSAAPRVALWMLIATVVFSGAIVDMVYDLLQN